MKYTTFLTITILILIIGLGYSAYTIMEQEAKLSENSMGFGFKDLHKITTGSSCGVIGHNDSGEQTRLVKANGYSWEGIENFSGSQNIAIGTDAFQLITSNNTIVFGDWDEYMTNVSDCEDYNLDDNILTQKEYNCINKRKYLKNCGNVLEGNLPLDYAELGIKIIDKSDDNCFWVVEDLNE